MASETLAFPWGSALVEAHAHHGASVVSVDFSFAGDASMSFRRFAPLAEGLARDIEVRGGIVGHIKAVAIRGDDIARLSLTEAGRLADIQGSAEMRIDDGAEFRLAVIAVALTEDDLKSLVVLFLESLSG